MTPIKPLTITIAAAAAVLTAACSQDTAADHDPQPVTAQAQPTTAPRPPLIVQERACGALDAIDHLADDAINPTADPGNPAPKPNGTNIISFASALQRVDRQGLSEPMSAAINAHAYALTNLGALINHGASREDIASMATVADTTSRTIDAFCDKA